MQVDSLFAQQDVHATSIDGQDIQCEQLQMKQTADGPEYTIQGEVSASAASDARNRWSDPSSSFIRSRNARLVHGAGSMRGTQAVADKTGAKPPSTQPIDVSWQDGRTERQKYSITISGNVIAKSTLEDGSIAQVFGKTMTIELTDPPATKPAAQRSHDAEGSEWFCIRRATTART